MCHGIYIFENFFFSEALNLTCESRVTACVKPVRFY